MKDQCIRPFFKDHILIHAIWTIFVLILIIVGLLSVHSYTDIELGKYIGIASSFSSVILAILAIIYAFISNSSLFSEIGSLKDAASSINSSAARIEMSSFTLADRIKDNTEHITTVLGKYADRDKQISPADPQQNTSQPIVLNDDNAKRFIIRSSFNGALLLLAYNFAIKSNKVFSITDYLGITNDDSFDYGSGYSVGAYASGLIDYEYIEESNRIVAYQITKVHEYILNNIEDILMSKLKKRNAARRKKLELVISNLKKYFDAE